MTVTPTPTPVLATIYGYVWRDDDHDGHGDEGEPGMGGVEVIFSPSAARVLSIRKERIAYTDAAGFFRFIDVVPGQYVVRLVRPVAHIPTTPYSLVLSLGLHQTVLVNFGFYPAPFVRYLPAAQRSAVDRPLRLGDAAVRRPGYLDR
jgi:hypothetical protein